MEGMNHEQEMIEDSNKQLRDYCEQLHAKIDLLNGQLEDANGRSEQLETDNRALQEELEQLRSQFSECEDQCADLKAKAEKAEAEKADSEDAYKKLANNIQELEGEWAEMCKERDELKEEIQSLKRVSTSKSLNDSDDIQFESEEMKELRKQVQDLTRERDQLASKREELTEQLQKAREELEAGSKGDLSASAQSSPDMAENMAENGENGENGDSCDVEAMKKELEEKNKLIEELQATLLQKKDESGGAVALSIPENAPERRGELMSSTLELMKKLEDWYKGIESRL